MKEIELLKIIFKNSPDILEPLNEVDKEIERLNKALKDIKKQLDYLETYSSKEDVYEDMSRRLNNIESIVNKTLGSDKE